MFGLPQVFVSNVGGGFTSLFARAVFNATGVDRRICTLRHLQANGQVERLYRTTRAVVLMLCAKWPSRWPEMIPHVRMACNVSYKSAIDNTPFYLLYGQKWGKFGRVRFE